MSWRGLFYKQQNDTNLIQFEKQFLEGEPGTPSHSPVPETRFGQVTREKATKAVGDAWKALGNQPGVYLPDFDNNPETKGIQIAPSGQQVQQGLIGGAQALGAVSEYIDEEVFYGAGKELTKLKTKGDDALYQALDERGVKVDRDWLGFTTGAALAGAEAGLTGKILKPPKMPKDLSQRFTRILPITAQNTLNPAFAGGGGGSQVLTKRTPSLDDIVRQPLQMTQEEAAKHWGKVTKADPKTLGITGAQKQADTSLSRVVRYTEEGRVKELSPREIKSVIGTHKKADPIKYLVEYHGGKLMNAESHHILDIDFWGRALDTPQGEIVSDVLWKNKIHTGNSGNNIVHTWASRRGSFDHDSLHRLYDAIPERQLIEQRMAQGVWQTMKPDAQAKLLRDVAYQQHRLTNNFFRMKLSFIKKQYPEIMEGIKHPKHLKNRILQDPDKYGQVPLKFNNRIFNPKDPQQVEELRKILMELPNTGGVSAEMKEVFSLTTPKAGAKRYYGSADQKSFDLTLTPKIRKAKRERIKKTNLPPSLDEWDETAQIAFKQMEAGNRPEARWRNSNIEFTWAPKDLDGKGRGYIDVIKDTAGDDDYLALKNQFFEKIETLPSGTIWTLEADTAQKHKLYKPMFKNDPRIKSGGDKKLLEKRGIEHFVLKIP